jgi:hypothetical protein
VREEEFVQRRKAMLMSGPGLSVGEKREEGVPLQSHPGGPWAGTRPGPKRFPVASFLFFCSFIFIFLFSCLIYNFCQIDPIQFKPLSKIF